MTPDPAPPAGTPIEALERKLAAHRPDSPPPRWSAIRDARAKTEELVLRLRGALEGLTDANSSIVVTGSLGRGEASDNSDVDWVLLVDGPSDPAHARLSREINRRIREAGFKDVGPTATFGNMVVSHDLVHYIAGTRDTNENLTRRILLLSESRALTNEVVRERVIRNVLARYVMHDRSVWNKFGRYDPIPHFLVNDMVRYWRTVTSDYASKMWERSGRGWATRNIKLRFSRKLLFVWGLLASFSGELFETEALRQAKSEEEFLVLLSELIRSQTDVVPLDLFARVLADDGVDPETASVIFSTYDEFLATIGDPATRRQLDELPFDLAAEDEAYARLRRASGRFRKAVNAVFFDQHPKLKELIRSYGVF